MLSEPQQQPQPPVVAHLYKCSCAFSVHDDACDKQKKKETRAIPREHYPSHHNRAGTGHTLPELVICQARLQGHVKAHQLLAVP